jgi:hypothetical protein
MKTSRVYPYLLAVLLLIVSLACVRSIPTQTAAEATESPEEEVLPTDATDVMNQIYLFATQTAMGPGGAPARGHTRCANNPGSRGRLGAETASPNAAGR